MENQVILFLLLLIRIVSGIFLSLLIQSYSDPGGGETEPFYLLFWMNQTLFEEGNTGNPLYMSVMTLWRSPMGFFNPAIPT